MNKDTRGLDFNTIEEQGECFEDVESPGKWPRFWYSPGFKNIDYIGHQFPTGAMTVSEDGHGRRCSKYWEFL